MRAYTIQQRRRAMTLLEMTLALVITAMVGLGVASMLNMASVGSTVERDGRAVMQRSHVAQIRLSAYFGPGLALLQEDPARGAALWLLDEQPGGKVNLTEFRAFWWDRAESQIVAEWVEFPDALTDDEKLDLDIELNNNADFLTIMEAQRGLGYTKTMTIVEGVNDVLASHDEARPRDSKHVALRLMVERDEGTPREVLLTFGLMNHLIPQ